jgi:hypothetical protein
MKDPRLVREGSFYHGVSGSASGVLVCRPAHRIFYLPADKMGKNDDQE